MSNQKNYTRLQRVAEWLQQEAYRQQIKGRTKPLKQFMPCERGVAITKHLRDEKIVTTVALQAASEAWCHCHKHLTLDELINIMFELEDEKIPKRS